MRIQAFVPFVSCVRCRKSGRLGGMQAHFKVCGTDQGEATFWAKVDKSPEHGGCWLYTGFRKWDGYGWLARDIPGRKSRYLTAHRYAWILKHGNVPEGLHVLHQCDNPPCCNPAHMRLGTHKENMAEMSARGRANGGKGLSRFNRPERQQA